MKRNSPPATRADLRRLRSQMESKLKSEFSSVRCGLETKIAEVRGALEVKIDGVREELEAKIVGVREGLEAKIVGVRGELKADIADSRRDLILRIERTQNDVREMKTTMATLATKGDFNRIMSAIDAFAGKAGDYGRTAVYHGQSLSDLQRTTKDHESRIRALESRAGA